MSSVPNAVGAPPVLETGMHTGDFLLSDLKSEPLIETLGPSSSSVSDNPASFQTFRHENEVFSPSDTSEEEFCVKGGCKKKKKVHFQ